MKLLAIIFLEALWLLSVFSFAHWRAAASIGKKKSRPVSNDLVFQLYLKISGLGVLGWVVFILAPGG